MVLYAGGGEQARFASVSTVTAATTVTAAILVVILFYVPGKYGAVCGSHKEMRA